jgi:hypothetical protein
MRRAGYAHNKDVAARRVRATRAECCVGRCHGNTGLALARPAGRTMLHAGCGAPKTGDRAVPAAQIFDLRDAGIQLLDGGEAAGGLLARVARYQLPWRAALVTSASCWPRYANVSRASERYNGAARRG